MDRYHAVNRHRSIINQYSILNQCLQLIGQSDIKTVKKYRIETYLIRTKIFLLNDSTINNVQCGLCSDDVFVGLLFQTKRMCREIGEDEAIDDFMKHIGGILTELGGNLDN